MRFQVLVLAFILSVISNVSADNLSQPGNLRFAVYSDTAAELFWTRSIDDESVQGYEIRLNGNVETVRDATSYFIDSLQPGVRYDFLVTALDADGNRSDSATVSFIGGDRGNNGPSQPSNLRAVTYSSSAIEIFWDRVPDAALTYEISIDSSVVASNQGTSFYTDDLDAGRRYTFSVIAIDDTGNRSSAAIVIADTAPGTDSGPAPQAPANVSILVYSRTAAELFWDRARADENVVSTEIKRDGVVVGMAEGNSFFDDKRDSGAAYLYELTTINNRGQRSFTTEFVEPRSTPIINRDNYIEIMADVFPTFFGDSYNKLLYRTYDLILSSFLNEVFSSGALTPITHVCINGGTAYFESSVFEIEFDNCQVGESVHDGQFGIQSGPGDWFYTDGLTLTTNPDTTLQINGTAQNTANYFSSARSVNVKLTNPMGALTLADANTQFSFTHELHDGPNFGATFKGSFQLSSPATRNQPISVSTLTNFSYFEPFTTHRSDWHYRKGLLRLVASDNSELILDADTGDDSNVSIQLTNTSGSEKFIHPWSSWLGVLRRSP